MSREREWLICRVLIVWCLCSVVSPDALCEPLPLRYFSTVDGLAHNSVHRVLRDSRGYVWFCTSEGLSRYDGYSFVNYSTDEGLPHRDVHDLLETKKGDYWVATADGVCLFVTSASTKVSPRSPKFVVFRPGSDEKSRWVTTLLEEPGGTILCGTAAGLYRFVPPLISPEASSPPAPIPSRLFRTSAASGPAAPAVRPRFERIDLHQPDKPAANPIVSALLLDRSGRVWIGSGSGLYCLRPDRLDHYDRQDGLPEDMVLSLLEEAGELWVGTGAGLCRMVREAGSARYAIERIYTRRDGLAGDYVFALVSVRRQLWIGTLTGLSRLGLDSSNAPAAVFQQDIGDVSVESLLKDSEGNLWVGTDGAGAIRVALGGFSTFSAADGLRSNSIISIFEDRSGRLCAISRDKESLFLNRLEGERFHPVRLNLPRHISSLGSSWDRVLAESEGHEWWVATGVGIARFSGVTDLELLGHVSPRFLHVPVLSRSGGNIFRLFRDSRGNLWMSSVDTEALTGLYRWDRSSRSFTECSLAQGLRWFSEDGPAAAFAEDRSGSLWVGFLSGGLVRLQNGRFHSFSPAEGAPDSGVRALHVDRAGRLWVGSGQKGVFRVDNPSLEPPRFVEIGRAQGLSSNLVLCLTEDQSGRIYIGTGSGVDCYDPATGHVRRYTEADGLIKGEIRTAFCDRDGSLWFGSVQGLSRLTPEADPPVRRPSIRLLGLAVAGTPLAVSELGDSKLDGLVLDSDRNDLTIDFVSPSFSMGERPGYQYRLEGSGENWGPVTEHRRVIYASLRPGQYRFQVRAVNTAGVYSSVPATVEFTVLAPVWQRWWFLAATGFALGWAIWAGHRYRVSRLVELEKVKTRIAADLHDDLGSNLSQIVLWSEVAQQRSTDPGVTQPLSQIAETSRELVDSLSDIVWAINPNHDKVSDLTHRIRRFASQLLAAQNIECQMRLPELGRKLVLDTNTRRQIYLILKESLNNVVRHSGCTKAEIELLVDGRDLILTVKDNGGGFDQTAINDGNGLRSMRQRAKALAGKLTITSGSRGTEILLRVPLKRWRPSQL